MAAASKVDLQLPPHGFHCNHPLIRTGLVQCSALVQSVMPLTVLLLTQNITYSELIAQLGISSIRELEDLIITECFYKGIVSGKLDQQKRCLQVSTTAMYSEPHNCGQPHDHFLGCPGNRVIGPRCAKRSAARSTARIATVVGTAQSQTG